ncbi:hypothetical protein FA15DRAFT_582791 [Coprinopsis marcescibilis]|uniref:Uncharacterized protein n=1 Tax=Coprinopsis marcescibilis TaxID=230819 RepID=A0A5C3L9U0_COPMA|nr:hypothetical protein FA15DRAFT_582791 [Coprinopsis marcescibilis]
MHGELLGRQPSLVELMLSPMSPQGHMGAYPVAPSFMPHPGVFMDYIADVGSRAWRYELVEALDCMNKKFANPYIIFYPVLSRDGMSFPINKFIRDIQGHSFNEDCAWRGNIVVGKYRDNPFTSMMDASMADFAMIKNYLLTHGCPPQVRKNVCSNPALTKKLPLLCTEIISAYHAIHSIGVMKFARSLVLPPSCDHIHGERRVYTKTLRTF